MIRTDWTSKRVIMTDFETVSLADLRKIGGRAYAQHPSTRVLCCAFRDSANARSTMWVPQGSCPFELPSSFEGFEVTRELPAWITDAVRDGVPLCGHNALSFDAHVWTACVKTDCTPAWRDTLPLCRAAALRGGLDAACERLFGVGKDPRGRVLDVLSRAYVRGGQVVYPVGTRAAWLDLIGYCQHDVVLLGRLHDAVIPFAEPDVLRVNQAINDRGVPLDVAFAARLVLLQDELSMKAGRTIAQITDDDLEMRDARSTAKVKTWLQKRGVRLPTLPGTTKESLNKDAVRALLDCPEDFVGDGDEELVLQVLRLRSEVVRVTTGKALRMIEAGGEDGRARDQMLYGGAHTLRWTGRQVQVHNFTRGIDGVDPSLARHDLTLEQVEAEAERLGCTPGDVLGSLLRPVVCDPNGPLSPCDFANVEARCSVWLAGEQWELERYMDPTYDPYNELARKHYGVRDVSTNQRKKMKLTALGTQYGMGTKKFAAQLESWGESGEEAEGIVDTYRRAHPAIVACWKELEAAALSACEGHESTVGRCRFYRLGDCLAMELPSGRRMVYRDARVEEKCPYWARVQGRFDFKKPIVTFMHVRGYRVDMWGGKWLENACQAGCRDLLADSLVRAEDAGMEPCMHVHDEIVATGDCAEELCRLMSTPPGWAAGFPLAAESFLAPRYFKKVHGDWPRYKFHLGVKCST